MSPLDRARRACREVAGPEVDLWSLPPAVVARAEATGRPIEVVARELASGWLLGRAAAGASEARVRLVELWSADVLRWCRWNAARGLDPDDAAQEVLLRAFARPRALPDPTGFRAWLWGVAWRVLREQERRAWLGRWFTGVAPEPVSDAPGADEGLIGAERVRLARRALAALPLEERSVLWLAYVEGLTRRAIAEVTGWPEGTVHRRLTQARAAFAREAARVGLAPGVDALEKVRG